MLALIRRASFFTTIYGLYFSIHYTYIDGSHSIDRINCSLAIQAWMSNFYRVPLKVFYLIPNPSFLPFLFHRAVIVLFFNHCFIFLIVHLFHFSISTKVFWNPCPGFEPKTSRPRWNLENDTLHCSAAIILMIKNVPYFGCRHDCKLFPTQS